MRRRIKTTFLVGTIAIVTVSLVAMTIWQYIEFKRELSYYEIQERWHQRYYIEDHYGIKEKTIDDISTLIENTKHNIGHASQFLPERGYFNVYRLIEKIKDICNSNNTQLNLMGIESKNKEFYEELSFFCRLKGKSKEIFNSLTDLRDDNLILRWEEACLLSNKNENIDELNLRFSAFFYIRRTSFSFRSNHSSFDPLQYCEVKIWVPPLSLWIKRHQMKAMAFKKKQKETPEFWLKIEMINKLKELKSEQRKMEVIIDTLQNISAGSEQVIINIKSCL